jgi:hypothetical protein
MEIEVPLLPQSDLDFDPLDILGDSIKREFLAFHLFKAAASRISDQLVSLDRLAVPLHLNTGRLHQIFEEAGAPITLKPGRFHI